MKTPVCLHKDFLEALDDLYMDYDRPGVKVADITTLKAWSALEQKYEYDRSSL